MTLKKLILMVFMYMMEGQKTTLSSSVGSLSIGGLIYIAKMAGMNEIAKLMADLAAKQREIDKEAKAGGCDEAAISEASDILHDIFDEFDNEDITLPVQDKKVWLLELMMENTDGSEIFATAFSSKDKLAKFVDSNAPVWDSNIYTKAKEIEINSGNLEQIENPVEGVDDGWCETPYDLLNSIGK